MRPYAAIHARATARLGVLALLLLGDRGLALATTADDLCAPDADPCVVDSIVAVSDGSTITLGARRLLVDGRGRLDVGPGTMSITAAAVTIAVDGEIRANGGSAIGGQIDIVADSIEITGAIVANGSIGGDVSLAADGMLRVAGTIAADGNTGVGFGGDIALSGAELSVAANLSAVGTSRGLGGCITFNAAANALLGGSVRANGGDGGEIAVVVGGGLGGGNLTFLPLTDLVVTGTDPDGGAGGDIDLSARGDGVQTGHIIIDGDAQARGGRGRDGGGDGGTIDVSAAGDLIGAAGRGTFDVNGGSPDGLAGEINFRAGRSATLANRLQAQTGSEGAGGDIVIEAELDLTLAPEAQVSVVGADDGGTIDLRVRQGEIRILSSTVDASGIFGGDGGAVSIEATGARGGVIITGSVFADGGAFRMSPGAGGAIDVAAGDFLTLSGPSEEPAGKIQAQGGNGGGAGGAIILRTGSGAMRLDGTVRASGLGQSSQGGWIAAVSGDGLIVGGTLDVGTDRQGGMIGLESTSTTDIVGNVMGGTIEVVADAEVTISGRLTADGSSGTEVLPGQVTINGCALEIAATGRLTAVGDGGRNRLVGREQMTIAGRLEADADQGLNELIYRDPANPPVVFGSAVIIPSRQEIQDSTLLPCPVCGDRMVEPPETCDDGNQLDGDGCSSSCQTEPAGLCDANGDGQANLGDLAAIATELFDGDGDRVIDVGGGTFPGTAGSDGNGDGRVTAADLIECAIVLSTP